MSKPQIRHFDFYMIPYKTGVQFNAQSKLEM